jgi:hypothetical protein
MVLDKPGKGAFYATPLHEMLQQATALRTCCSWA